MTLNPFEGFKVILTIMLIYGVGITLITYALPAEALPYADFAVSGISSNATDYSAISSDVSSNFEQQKSVPLVEVGALVFYSGNILLDLLINFITALPQLIVLVLNGIMLLFGGGLNATLMGIVQGFSFAAITIFYLLGVTQTVLSIRSGRVV